MTKNQPKNFLIIDGNAIIHRAYHAMPETLTTSKGEMVNAVYGFSMMLLNVMNKIHFDYIVCTFDMAAPVFRKEIYQGYKENRKKMDDGLASQLQRIREVVEAFNIPIFEREGYEADDVIGSLVKHIQGLNEKGENITTIIVSGDKDTLQLINERVEVILPGKTFADMVIYDLPAFRGKYGFDPIQLIDFKALFGDKSDNIPGVYKVGEKSAMDLVRSYGNVESIYEHLAQIKPALAKHLEAGRENAFLSKRLATIHQDLDISLDLEHATFLNFDKNKVQKKFLELEFKSLLSKVPQPQREYSDSKEEAIRVDNPVVLEKETQEDTQYTFVQTKEDFEKLMGLIKEEKLFAIDTETTSLNVFESDLVGVSIGFSGKRAFFLHIMNGVAVAAKGLSSSEKKGFEMYWSGLLEILESDMYKKVGHNIKYDMHALARSSIKLNGVVFDTLLASYLLNIQPNDLKGLALVYEGEEMSTFSEITDNGKTFIRDLPFEVLSAYACADADLTYRLYERFRSMLELPENLKVKDVFYSMEMPLIRVLFSMEHQGIALDSGHLNRLEKELSGESERLKKEIYDIVGHEFNINSPKQLSEVIFNELRLPLGRKTKTGYSTDERYFNSIGLNAHPIVLPIRQYKELVKLINTYITTLPKQVDKEGRIHTSYNQAVTATGRLSSSNPNLQNIPTKTEIGNRIREAFVADKNSLFISFDYSQIELRIMAHVSGDEELKKAFANGADVHRRTAQFIFGKTDITPKERSIAKTINFGIIYGISSFGLSEQLGIPRGEAQMLIDRYFATYKGVRAYLEKQKESVLQQSSVESLMGRRRTFLGMERASMVAKNAMIREAINMPIQGTNADLIKIAMNEASEFIQEKKYPADMLLQVHDELIFEYALGVDCSVLVGSSEPLSLKGKEFETFPQLRAFILDIKLIMERCPLLSIPVKVDVAVGCNWGDLRDVLVEE